MKVLFTCGDRPLMARNKFYRKVLSEKYDYTECISHGKTYARRLPSIFLRLPFKLWNKDLIFVSYMGYFLVIFIRIFSKKPIVYDYYLSLFEMLCLDRKLFKEDSLLGKFTFWLDKRSLELADYIILDTSTMIKGAVDRYDIDPDKFIRLPLAVNEEKIYPMDVKRHKEMFTFVYMGSYIPFHGVDILMKAAKLVQDKGMEFHLLMLGKGQTYEENMQLSKDLKLKNIEFISYVSMEELNHYYNASDVTIGVFVNSVRSKGFITNKAYEAFAIGKPHLTLKTPAMQELFVDNETIFFVDESSEVALAERMLEIIDNKALRDKVAVNAMNLYQTKLTNEKVVELLEEKVLSKFS